MFHMQIDRYCYMGGRVGTWNSELGRILVHASTETSCRLRTDQTQKQPRHDLTTPRLQAIDNYQDRFFP